MSSNVNVKISTLPTGVPGLDEVLGGGLPEFSFNLIAGEPGAGKTILAQQIVFANASKERPALYFTVLGEPTIKLLRYQQQMSFFDPSRMGSEVRIVNLSEEVIEQNLDAVLARILREVERTRPRIVVVDSFRTVTTGCTIPAAAALEQFVQRLAIRLTSWEVTSFLVGEYLESELRNPVFTVADGAFWMTQEVDRNSVVRKLRVLKMRGMPTMPGLHTVRISSDGVRVFPRTSVHPISPSLPGSGERLSTGIPDLDEMMGGGIPKGDTVIVAGPTGGGKTTFASRFIAAGCERGEAAVMVVFEERPREFAARALALGVDIDALEERGLLRLLYFRPLDLSPDEVLHEIGTAIAETGALRVVIDSLAGFEVALAPSFRSEFRESLYRVVMALTGGGKTVMLTLETPGTLGPDLPELAFIADDVLVQRQVVVNSAIHRTIGVLKMRGSSHSSQLREYWVSAQSVRIGGLLNLGASVPPIEVTSS